jgi:hypothetical protein
VVFVLTEFQILDRATEQRNEIGEASHAAYKDRQKRAVMHRLKVGTGGAEPHNSTPPAKKPNAEHGGSSHGTT